MPKGRMYIPVNQNSTKYRIYLDDLSVWGPVIKKSTPPLPLYYECKTIKW